MVGAVEGVDPLVEVLDVVGVPEAMITASPSSWARRISSFSSSGVPQRDEGAKKLDTW